MKYLSLHEHLHVSNKDRHANLLVFDESLHTNLHVSIDITTLGVSKPNRITDLTEKTGKKKPEKTEPKKQTD